MDKPDIVDTNLEFGALTERESTNRIVIHHVGNPTDEDISAAEIHESHLAQGWAGIGYHFVIRKDGSIEQGRPENTIGAHAYGFNSDTIGINVAGNFEIGEPTESQKDSLAMLIAYLADKYGLTINEDTVCGHRDLMATACPGDNLYNLLGDVRGNAVWYQQHT